jgi:polyisoprenoid-binding protein YceI
MPGRPPRKRHWQRWIVVSVVVLAVAAVAGGMIAVRQSSAPVLALRGGPVAAPVGPVDGTWDAAAGSVAGFRVRLTALGTHTDVTGRTDAVAGSLVISGGQVIRAAFRVGLASITVNGKAQPQFASSLDTRQYPSATVTLDRPVSLGPAFASGATITVAVTGHLTLRGTSQPVTFAISARRDGTTLQAVGSIPVAFSRWGITQPANYGAFASLASRGTAEFLLVLHRDAGAGHGTGTVS